ALIDAKPGDTVAFGAGRFEFTDGLSLDIDDVTVKGAGQDKTFLDFKGQKSGGDGLLITSDRVTVRDLAVQDTRGDGIKAKGVDQISYLNVLVEWTGGPKETNGAYGVYPVSSTNVLIDTVTVKGAADAGIYVGQSKNIVVRNSRAEFNVAGIEIENSMNADVHDNVATHNAGGILVFDLPDLPQQGGHSTRVYRNRVVDNDTRNFAPKNSTVAGVPTGTGVMVMANRDVHVFDNEIAGNQSAAVMVIGYRQPIKDANYEALPSDIVVRDNRIGRNGWAPTFEGGAELAQAAGGTLPPVLWDGATGFTRAGQSETRKVNVVLKDGPVMNLNLATPSDLAQARPEVTPTVEGAPVAEPTPVVLPDAQAALTP
ncbi:MAG: right-handed parallel beta-helix repeat-containing protein, partial [Caulobacteraceae bacterium]|nr:right-handed parallel beta-helix repeat-containing protein [Caulobacteraceae bacterium]